MERLLESAVYTMRNGVKYDFELLTDKILGKPNLHIKRSVADRDYGRSSFMTIDESECRILFMHLKNMFEVLNGIDTSEA